MSLNIPEFIRFLAAANTHVPIEANFKITIDNIFKAANEKEKSIITKIANNGAIFQSYVSSNLKVISESKYWPESLSTSTLLFANGVTIPGESSALGRVGAASDSNGLHGGLLSSPVLKGRKDFANLEITFLETDISFIDSILRPWSVAVAHYGLYARLPTSDQNLKTKVTVEYLSKTSKPGKEGEDVVRKKILFNDAAPVEVGGFESSYGSTGKSTEMRISKTVWTYSTYEISYPIVDDTKS